jgi:hypothetical protein
VVAGELARPRGVPLAHQPLALRIEIAEECAARAAGDERGRECLQLLADRRAGDDLAVIDISRARSRSSSRL